MKAAILHEIGGPDAYRVEDTPVPEIASDQALVRVLACGVSGHDVAERNGTYRRGVRLPKIAGMEICGDVVSVGAEVHHLNVGDRVCNKPWHSCGLCRMCRSGRETSCPDRSASGHGGYGEFAALPAETLVRIPRDIPPPIAAVLGAAVGVALNAVRDTAQVRLGESVLVTGGSGGVGWSAVQLAALSGAMVIATTRSPAKVADLEEAGAGTVVVTDGDRWFDHVIDATSGRGVNVVIDTVGSPVFGPAFRSLADYGRYALVGQLTGEEVSINLARLFFKRARLLGVGSVTRAQIEDAAALVHDRRLQPRVAKVLPLRRIADAHRIVESGVLVGRVVVTPDG